MKMILHILRKDLRRQRWELAMFAAACGMWAWQMSHPANWLLQRQPWLPPVLLFGLWFFTIVRAVHGESLVGDKEFWPTRPYHWGKLMTAKALLLALCLNGPLFVAEAYLLAHAGLPVSGTTVAGLFFLQLEFAFFLTFPAWTLAAVTETLVQWILAIAGMLVFALVVSWLPWNKLQSPLEGGENVVSLLGGGFIVCALAFVLVWQYARRRVWPARLVIAGSILLVPLMILIAPSRIVRSIAYPSRPIDSPFRLSIYNSGAAGAREYRRINGEFSEWSDPEIGIPVVAGSLDANAVIVVDGWRVTLAGDNGWHWQSQWINQALQLSYDSPGGEVHFSLPAKLANQLGQVHATASIEVAYGSYKLGPARRVDTSSSKFDLPGVGVCRWDPMPSGFLFQRAGPTCSAPLRLPAIMTVRVDSAEDTCRIDEVEGPVPAGHYATTQVIGNHDVPADFDPNPVHDVGLSLGSWIPEIPSARNPRKSRDAQLCRGTPISLRIGSMMGKARAQFDLGPLGTEKIFHPSFRETPDSE